MAMKLWVKWGDTETSLFLRCVLEVLANFVKISQLRYHSFNLILSWKLQGVFRESNINTIWVGARYRFCHPSVLSFLRAFLSEKSNLADTLIKRINTDTCP